MPQYFNPDGMQNTLDGIYNAYLAQKQRETEQSRFDQAQARQRGADALQFGFDPAAATPENIAAASRPASHGEGDLIGPIRAFLTAKKNKASMETRGGELDLRLKESQIVENQAQAEKARMEGRDGNPLKRPAATEFTARGFADKAKQAHDALSGLEASGYKPAALTNAFQSIMPTMAQSGQFQQSEQARRQFVNAILRRESGAAIPPSELANYTKQYFPIAGDGPEVLRQKAQARELAIAGLEQEGARVPSAYAPATESKTNSNSLSQRAAEILAQRRANAAGRPGR